MRDTIGGRPYEIKNQGGKKTIQFFPMNDNAKNPDAVLFRITLDKTDIKKTNQSPFLTFCDQNNIRSNYLLVILIPIRWDTKRLLNYTRKSMANLPSLLGSHKFLVNTAKQVVLHILEKEITSILVHHLNDLKLKSF